MPLFYNDDGGNGKNWKLWLFNNDVVKENFALMGK